MKRGVIVSDLHCGSIFGLLPPGLETSEPGNPVKLQNIGQEYLYRCWDDFAQQAGLFKPDFIVVNGDLIDGRQEAQRGTELSLPIVSDQKDAAIQCLQLLIDRCSRPKLFLVQGCLMPGHRVLTADLRWMPIEDLSVGTGLLSFRHDMSKWEMAAITAYLPIKKECLEVILETGESFRCTVDHPFLVYVGTTRIWKPASCLRESDKLARLLPVWKELTSKDAGYVAAFFDGEGSLDYGVGHGAVRISAAQRPNVVIKKVREELEREGYELSKGYAHYKNSDCENYSLLGGQKEILRFLGSYRPPRLLSKFRGPSKLGRQRAMECVRVVSIKTLGIREVVGLSTTSGTYIADGFGHHNTEYHDAKAAEAVEDIGRILGAERYFGVGSGKLCKEVLWLDVEGVILEFAHHISIASGFYRLTPLDRELQWSAMSAKDVTKGIPKADLVVRSHCHHYGDGGHASKQGFTTPCWQLQTRFMRRHSVHRMHPDIGGVLLTIDGDAKRQHRRPCQYEPITYSLPPVPVTKLE